MNLRTDLALERREIIEETEPEGIKSETTEVDGAKITRIEVVNEKGEKALGKPIGKYITVEVPPFTRSAQLSDSRLDSVANELASLLPESGTILVVGLGNTDITPDALGPKSIELVLATRHISSELAKSAGLGDLRPVACFIPGVLGRTGVETGETILGVVKTVNPSAVITIDALAARRLSRLGCTVQMADTGVTPGSGVGNARAEICEKNLGVPVIAVGVPTVVDAATLAYDLVSKNNKRVNEEDMRERLEPEGSQMMITPREIDLVIERAARLIAMSINRALQPHISVEDMLSLVS
ncbi:MAG: GPR endopeptidase [Clostridiales bacterium]|jgi:spore protease|nr:GPR endopeptidase [Clostridiales bacterium]